jgi:hypothetical protein
MSDYVYTYATILSKAKAIKTKAEKEYQKPAGAWSYYICKAILKPKTSIKKITVNGADHSTGNDFSRQITKSQYIDMAKRLIKYVETNHQIPNYITVAGKNMRVSDYTYMFARILVYYDSHNQLPAYANVNSKAFTKPTESGNAVFDYFVKVFGNITSIDDALEKISGRGYGYYYDDVYSNRTSIDRMHNGQGVNCTDSCQVFYNIIEALIHKGKYRKVECLHVQCSGGDGHVRLRITMNDGSYIYRDPAAVLSSGDITYNWCSDGELLAVNPSWFMENLNR